MWLLLITIKTEWAPISPFSTILLALFWRSKLDFYGFGSMVGDNTKHKTLPTLILHYIMWYSHLHWKHKHFQKVAVPTSTRRALQFIIPRSCFPTAQRCSTLEAVQTWYCVHRTVATAYQKSSCVDGLRISEDQELSPIRIFLSYEFFIVLLLYEYDIPNMGFCSAVN